MGQFRTFYDTISWKSGKIFATASTIWIAGSVFGFMADFWRTLVAELTILFNPHDMLIATERFIAWNGESSFVSQRLSDQDHFLFRKYVSLVWMGLEPISFHLWSKIMFIVRSPSHNASNASQKAGRLALFQRMLIFFISLTWSFPQKIEKSKVFSLSHGVLKMEEIVSFSTF